MTGNGWVLHSAIPVETREGVSLSQAAAAKITVSPTSVFGSMKTANTGVAYAETITVTNCPSKPTVTVKMTESIDGGVSIVQGNAVATSPVSAGANTWTFTIYPTDWYWASGSGSGIVMKPGEYCQGTCTVASGGQTAAVYIRGAIRRL